MEEPPCSILPAEQIIQKELISNLVKTASLSDKESWSHIPGMPSFSNSTWNGVAVVPLLSSNSNNSFGSKSYKSFQNLLGAFRRYSENSGREPSMSPSLLNRGPDGINNDEDDEEENSKSKIHGKNWKFKEDANIAHLIIANNQLTRPGDWKYDTTPLRCFDWNNGCQRIKVFDGRPDKSRMAHDRVVNKNVSRDWADLIPSRRTAAVVGVLNCRDCLSDPSLLERAHEELNLWAHLYSVPWYEVTAAFQNEDELHFPTEITVLQRMFVFDSFDEESQRTLNLAESPLGSALVAFPPCDDEHTHMMDLHLNVVINDLAVAILRSLEDQIRLCDSQAKAFGPIVGNFGYPQPQYARLNSQNSENPADIGSIVANTPSAMQSKDSLSDEHASEYSTSNKFSVGGKLKSAMLAANAANTLTRGLRNVIPHTPPKPRLLYTPIDHIVDISTLTSRDADAIKKRDVGRREKYAADLSLLSGSPIDALSRYTHAAELTKGHDPLWYAFSQLGCAESFIAMADMGGHGVDAYLENNFQYPEEIMALLLVKRQQEASSNDNVNLEKKYTDRTKTTLPNALYYKTDEVLNILSRHPQLVSHYVELLIKLARYISDIEDNHLQCRWGYGSHNFSGDFQYEARYHRIPNELGVLTSQDLKNTSKRDYNIQSSFSKLQRVSDLYHRAVSAAALDPRTRVDVSTLCARLCILGVNATFWGENLDEEGSNQNLLEPGNHFRKLRLVRKAAFFTTIAAESMLYCQRQGSDNIEVFKRSASLWLAASNLYSREENKCMDYGHYAWASIRATLLHGLSLQVDHVIAERAAELFMVLLSEICPDNTALNLLKSLMKSSAGAVEDNDSLPETHTLGYSSIDNDEDSATGNESISEMSMNSSRKYMSNKKQNLVNNSAASTSSASRSAFFTALAGPAASWSIAQSKWLEDDPIPNLYLPLLDLKDAHIIENHSQQNSFPNTNDYEQSTLSLGLINPYNSNQNSGSGLDGSMVSSVFNINTANSSSSSISGSLISINCVVPNVKFDSCARIQAQNISHLISLRRDTPTLSFSRLFHTHKSFAIYNDTFPSIPPPIQVISANVVKSESHLLLERSKAFTGGKGVNTSSIATFFNPYAKNNKSESGTKVASTLVAQGEERYLLIIFENLLSIPLDIPSCQLEFEKKSDDEKEKKDIEHRMEIPPLSFTIPAKCKNFSVRFPFIVLAKGDSAFKKNAMDDGVPKEEDAELGTDIIDLIGLRVTCLNRSFLISFGLGNDKGNSPQSQQLSSAISNVDTDSAGNNSSTSQLPEPASIYQKNLHIKPQQKQNDQLSCRIEAVPPQPSLLVSFTTSQTPLEDSAVVPVHLSDGEIYTIPPFRLENDFGASGLGQLERLQIVAVGLPGLPDEVLFDTDAEAFLASKENEDNLLALPDDEDEENESNNSDDFQELMEIDGLPPLRMKAIIHHLTLKSINNGATGLDLSSLGKRKSHHRSGNVVTFQIAGMHDMGNSLANGGHVRIRFRYRGPSPNAATEIWRKREVNLRIVRVKGPRISSLSFRSDLSWGSAFTELSRALSQQKLRLGNVPKWGPSTLAKRKMASSSASQRDLSMMNVNDESSILIEENEDDSNSFVLTRVGKDMGVHVSANEIVVLMAVANETNSTIVLSNRKGRVGGFEGSPMSTVRVTSGVSVKIPVVIERIERLDEEGNVVDIAAELISRTALQWESATVESTPGSTLDSNPTAAAFQALNSSSMTLTAFMDKDISSIGHSKAARHGRVRIPSRCLREIIEEHKSFASRICKAPVNIRFDISSSSASSLAGKEVQVLPGVFIDTKVEVTMQDWVPDKVISNIAFTLEFCCAKKDSESGNHEKNILLNYEDSSDNSCCALQNPYIWSGQLRRCVRGIKTRDECMTHNARIAFVESGTYVVSACVKISSFLSSSNSSVSEYDTSTTSGEEIWWAPRAETVQVLKDI